MASLIHFLIKVKHQAVAVEHSVLEIICKLYCIEVSGVRTELAEHAVAKVVLIVIEHLLFLACLRILFHMTGDLDGSVRAGFLTQCAGRTLVAAILVALEGQTPAVTLCHMECGLAVLGILLCRLVGEEVLEVFLPGHLHARCQRLGSMPYLSEISFAS